MMKIEKKANFEKKLSILDSRFNIDELETSNFSQVLLMNISLMQFFLS